MIDTTHADWRKSTRSGNGGNCVQVATNLVDDTGAPVVLVRDSKNPTGAYLTFTPAVWRALVGGVKGGEFEL